MKPSPSKAPARPFSLQRLRHKTLGWYPLAGAGVLLLLAVAWAYISRPAAEVYRVQRGTAISAVYGTVKIEWTYAVPVRAQNYGYIQLAPGIGSGQVSIGLKVHKDQLLATIIDEAAARNLTQARIDLQAAEAKKAVGPADTGALQSAQDNLARMQKLYDMQGISDQQLQLAKIEVRKQTDAVAAEQITLDQAVQTGVQSLKSLEDKMSKTEIKSPIDGILTAVNSNEGELVNENAAVFTVAVANTYISGQVNEEDVGAIHEKLKAKVRLYSFPDTPFTATVAQILPYPDPATQRYTVILNLDNKPDNLMAGMTGEMNIIIGERPDALLVPNEALINNTRVFVVDHGVVKRRDVTVGYHTVKFSEISSGLRDGEFVIKGDQDLYRSGERVRAIEVNPDLSSK